MRIAVCDDSPEYLQNTVEMIKMWSKESNMDVDVFSFDNGDDLLRKCPESRFDLIFLDIIMPLFNGIDTAREIRQTDSEIKIVFLTSSTEFALDSYDVKASGYLLKPVEYDRIKETLDDYCKTKWREPKSIVVKTSVGFQKVYLHNIEYVEAQNKKVIFYLKSGSQIEVNESFHAVEEKLPVNDGFFKCHRSYIVYLRNIDHFNSTEIFSRNGKVIPIARGFSKPLQEAYFANMFDD